MAVTKAGTALTEAYRAQQLALRAAVVRDVAKLWPMWQPANPASYEAFETAMALLVQSRSQHSWALAARYYQTFAGLEAPGAAVKQAIQIAASRSASQIQAVVSATSRAAVYAALGAGQPYEAAMANGLVQVSGSVSRLVLDAGRETILDAVKRDSRALGWARVTGGDSCAFCAMLASRGPVYESAAAATAGSVWVAEVQDFQAHDHCTCGAEPIFSYESEWPGRGRELQRRWQESDGTLNGFRQSLNKKPAAAAAAVANT